MPDPQIIVGNEYILNMAGTDSTTSSAYLSAAQDIIDHIQEVNTTIKGMNLNKHLPIGTSDAGSVLSTTLATGIDFFMANVHPWFATEPVDTAAVWTYNFFHEFDVVSWGGGSSSASCELTRRMSPRRHRTTRRVTLLRLDGQPVPTTRPRATMERPARVEMLVLPICRVGRLKCGARTAQLMTAFLDTFVCQANANGTHYF